MKNSVIRIFIVFAVLSSIIIIAGCQQHQPMLEGSEIPEGDMPNREATYDDIEFTPGGPCYKSNFYQSSNPVISTETVLGTNDNDPHVSYRDHISTKAGQIRYNLLVTWIPNVNNVGPVNIRVVNTTTDIKVIKVMDYDGLKGRNDTVLALEIAQQTKPGDYKIEFVIYINGDNRGRIPCVIEVVE